MRKCPLDLETHSKYYGIWYVGKIVVTSTRPNFFINFSNMNKPKGILIMFAIYSKKEIW
jgi:hypothetical protein